MDINQSNNIKLLEPPKAFNSDSKKCCNCEQVKLFTEFYKLKKSKDGYGYVCKECKKTEMSKEQRQEYNKNYYTKNKEKLLEKNKLYRIENEDKINVQRKIYRENNKEHISNKNKEYLPIRKIKIQEKRKINLDFRLSEIIRSKYHKMITGKETSYKDIIGCSSDLLRKWLKFQFDENMNWNNLGEYWQIDHILPISLFDFEKDINIKICYNWTNLQPLHKNINRSKSNKLELHYYFNSIITIHRFIQHYKLDKQEYQIVNESLQWLRNKLRYGENLKDA